MTAHPNPPASSGPPDTPGPTTRPGPLEAIVDSAAFRNFILAVIVLNSVVLGMQTSGELLDAGLGPALALIDALCLAIFVVELALKLVAWRGRFFRDGWNLFDFAVVAVSFVPGAGSFSVLRALRVLRVMRLFSAVPSLRRVVNGLVRALPGMGSVLLIMAIIFYAGSVMATGMFGATFPEWFGSIGGSAYSLFQIMTLESWSMGIVRPVMEVYPLAWAFFVPFIISTSFAVMNLVVGLVVTAMQEAQEQADEEALAERQAGKQADGREAEALEVAVFQARVLERLEAIEHELQRQP